MHGGLPTAVSQEGTSVNIETNRINSVLFGRQNGTFGPYLTAINGIRLSAVCAPLVSLPENI
jgi:hypothetical protein